MLRPRLEGKWIANCDFWTGCAAKQAWIGLDFDVLPKTVRCIRINQPPHEGYYEIPRCLALIPAGQPPRCGLLFSISDGETIVCPEITSAQICVSCP